MPVIGVDNYSFHRLLGEVRAGEVPPAAPHVTWDDTISIVAGLGGEAVALETCFMSLDAAAALGPDPTLPVMFSWGHPYGLEYGANPDAEADALSWLEAAAALGHDRMRIVIAHPDLRPADDGWLQTRACVPAVSRIAERAAHLDVTIAVENHADLTAEQLAWLVAEVGSPALAVCLDVANAVRVGDDPVEAARLLAAFTVAAHVKDLADEPWHPRSGPRSVPLGTGNVRLAEVFAILAAGGRDPWLLVEVAHLGPDQVDDIERIAEDLSWLRTHA